MTGAGGLVLGWPYAAGICGGGSGGGGRLGLGWLYAAGNGPVGPVSPNLISRVSKGVKCGSPPLVILNWSSLTSALLGCEP